MSTPHPTAVLDDRASSRAAGDAAYWGEIGSQWAGGRPAPLWRRHSDWLHAQLLDRWLPREPVARVLKTDLFDEAVCRGVHERLRASARTVVGFDLAASTLRAARANRPDLVALVADVRCLPLADRSFDVVVSLSTLDHFRSHAELRESLGELARILKPGGSLILTLDNPLHPAVALRNALIAVAGGRFPLVPYFVGKTVGPRRLGRLLLKAGLELLEVTTTTHVPRALAVAFADRLDGWVDDAAAVRFLASLARWERMRGWPTQFLTGHYIAVHARRMSGEAAG